MKSDELKIRQVLTKRSAMEECPLHSKLKSNNSFKLKNI